MRKLWKGVGALALSATVASVTPQALAFCGFYVAQADAQLFNNASRVVLARKGNQTTLTMSNDYKGSPKEFAIVIPVPTVIQKDQIRIADPTLIDQIDGFTAPRMVEYWDPDPCPKYRPEDDYRMYESASRASPAPTSMAERRKDSAYGVTVEATYDVGEYDIVILSAEDSTGLESWLQSEGYHLPGNASDVLQSYIRQNMHFFVAKVDLAEHNALEQPFLSPLQVTYASPKFMLPIRLGMVNADGPQDLVIYALTEKGRIESTNYRTTKIPTDEEVPEFVQQEFGPFYKDLFAKAVKNQGMETVFTEYAWPLSVSCDPCTGVYLSGENLKSLGAEWASEYHGGVSGGYVTRLHVRYDMAHFPEDLVFQETSDSSTFQGRYIINHPYVGDTSCAAGREYETTLATRNEKDVRTLSSLTGWDTSRIRAKIPARANPTRVTPPKPPPTTPKTWWDEQ